MGKTKHGYYGEPEYISWQAMKARCLNPNAGNYKNYGAKGVTVCERWLKFENFLVDMGRIPDDDYYLLERIKNELGYEPGNCKWATRSEQNINKGYKSSTGVRGISKTGIPTQPYQVSLWINHKLAHFGRFRTLEEAKAKLDEVRGGVVS